MDLIFIDDAEQKNPSRKGMFRMLSVGGLYVPETSLRDLEKKLELLCREYNFPEGEMFKWSPGRELWMHDNLIGKNRRNFMSRAVTSGIDLGIKVIVVISDTQYRTATDSQTHEMDLLKLFLERTHWLLRHNQTIGMVVASQPSGNRRNENKFLANCLETLKTGTEYVEFETIPLGVLSCPPKYIRMLQLADVVTSCSVAFVSGESQYSPPIFSELIQLLATDGMRIGGIGLKLHPDNVYCNLYHWLLGDQTLWKGNSGMGLPFPNMPYSDGPNQA